MGAIDGSRQMKQSSKKELTRIRNTTEDAEGGGGGRSGA
jgi:hypothetical protein